MHWLDLIIFSLLIYVLVIEFSKVDTQAALSIFPPKFRRMYVTSLTMTCIISLILLIVYQLQDYSLVRRYGWLFILIGCILWSYAMTKDMGWLIILSTFMTVVGVNMLLMDAIYLQDCNLVTLLTLLIAFHIIVLDFFLWLPMFSI